MKIPLLIELQSQGNEIEAFLNRIGGNEVIAQTILKKFLEDLTMEALRKNVQEKNTEQIRNCAHTLKGVALNLGFTNLSEAAKRLQYAVENEQDEIQQDYESVQEEYNRIVQTMLSYKGES